MNRHSATERRPQRAAFNNLEAGRRPQRAAFIIAGGLALFAAVILWDASGLKQDGGYAGVGPADVPRMVAYGLLLLSALTVIAGIKGRLPQPPPQAPAPILWILGGLGLQLMLLHTAGFVIAASALFGFTARGMGKRPLWLCLLVGFVVAMLVYGLFDRILKLSLPNGVIETLVFGG